MYRTLFISYSRADMVETDWLARLRMYLTPFRRTGNVDVWDDSKLIAGTRWRDEIARALERATVAVLLVGPGFLASEFVVEYELPILLRAAQGRGLTLFPLIVGYCGYRESDLGPYQAYNSTEAPLESLSRAEQNRVLNSLAIDIAKTPHNNTPLDTVAGSRSSLCDIMREMQRHLADTLTAFLAQRRRRNDLVATIERRLGFKNELSYEKFFFRYHPQLSEDERFEFDQIRAITEGPLHTGNHNILQLIETHPEVLEVSPMIVAVRQHLVFWLNKYDKVFSQNRAMCLLYTGVEDGVPFPGGVDPGGVDHLVETWLSENCR
jgi:hypothetical protein